MANTLPATQASYDTLCNAIAQGALRVKYDGKEIDFRNLNEMLRIKSMMENSLGIGKKKINRAFISFKNGL